MNWKTLAPSGCGTHHVTQAGRAAYSVRFDDVLKFHAPGLAPVSRAGEAWHIQPDGSPAYTSRYLRTFGFYEGLAAVISAEGWHHVTPEGIAPFAERFAWCGNYQGGRCTVREQGGAYLHIDPEGRPVYPERWRYAGDYRDGVAVVQAESGRSTHIDAEGRLLHSKWFWDLDVFHKGYARARDADGWMHVGLDGVAVYARRFAAVEPFYNGQARVERFDGALEVIDEAGETIVELRGPTRSEFAALSGDMVGFWRTQTIAAAVELGVIAALPGTAGDVAAVCGLRPSGAHRILRALGELKIARSDGDDWRLTDRGRFLQSDHPLTLADAALEYAGAFSRAWADLPAALRVDSEWSAPTVFDDVAEDHARTEGHHRMLRSYARHDYGDVVSSLGLAGGERIVDAAGGTGSLAALVLDAHPSCKVVVLDRPEVVEQGRVEHVGRPGLTWKGGDIFSPWETSADVVVLARVLHDWDDERARLILRRARASLRKGGRVCVVEMLMHERGVAGALCDLHLLAVTGGRERTASEFGELLDATGFSLDAVRPTCSLTSVVVGVAI